MCRVATWASICYYVLSIAELLEALDLDSESVKLSQGISTRNGLDACVPDTCLRENVDVLSKRTASGTQNS